APANVAFGQWPSLDRTRIHAVREGQETAAEKLLARVPSVELTAQQAADLVGQPLPDVQLAVTHRSMGSQPVPMKREALVLQLERAPVEVFVGASMTQ
ncbi:MAG: hypothetical protein MUC51_07075, partial [Anaerolineae bacterium]|nr:hypothetical protein [Anaerolineae bacterium]